MYGDNESNNSSGSSYEGIFARQPDSVEHSVWGTREVYNQPLSPNIEVTRDWYGNARVENGGFDW